MWHYCSITALLGARYRRAIDRGYGYGHGHRGSKKSDQGPDAVSLFFFSFGAETCTESDGRHRTANPVAGGGGEKKVLNMLSCASGRLLSSDRQFL